MNRRHFWMINMFPWKSDRGSSQVWDCLQIVKVTFLETARNYYKHQNTLSQTVHKAGDKSSSPYIPFSSIQPHPQILSSHLWLHCHIFFYIYGPHFEPSANPCIHHIKIWLTKQVYPRTQVAVKQKEQKVTFRISGFFQGPLSERIQPPWSAQVQVPPRNSGSSLVQVKAKR